MQCHPGTREASRSSTQMQVNAEMRPAQIDETNFGGEGMLGRRRNRLLSFACAVPHLSKAHICFTSLLTSFVLPLVMVASVEERRLENGGRKFDAKSGFEELEICEKRCL